MEDEDVIGIMNSFTIQMNNKLPKEVKRGDIKLKDNHPLVIQSNVNWFKERSEVLSKISDEQMFRCFKKRYNIIETLIHAKDFLAIKDPKEEYLINPFIPKGQIIIIFSLPKKKKSLLALNIGSCIASGKKWFGKYPVKKSAVEYLVGEDPSKTARKRLRLIARGANISVKRRKKDNFPFHLKERNHCSEFTDEFIENLIEEIRYHHIKLVILDTISIFLSEGEDSNNAESIVRVFKRIYKIVDETGVSFLVLYHSNKKGKEILGSVKFEASADLIYRLDYDSKEDISILHCYSSRDIEKGLKFKVERNEKDTKFHFIEELNGIIEDGTKCDSKNKTEQAKEIILEAVEDKALNHKELLELCKNDGISPRTFNRALNILYEKEEKIGYSKEEGGYYLL